MNDELTPVAKLQAVIEAQIKGGHLDWEWWIPGDTDNHRDGDIKNGIYDIGLDRAGVLEILQDTQGLKAAYGKDSLLKNHWISRWLYVSREILLAWHSGEGNDWNEAINTAYKHLDLINSQENDGKKNMERKEKGTDNGSV